MRKKRWVALALAAVLALAGCSFGGSGGGGTTVQKIDRPAVVTPAVTGSIEATEVLKIICGFGEVLSGKLWTIDLHTLQSNKFSL